MAAEWYTQECLDWIERLGNETTRLDWRKDILPAQNTMRPSAMMLVEVLLANGWWNEEGGRSYVREYTPEDNAW